MTKFRTALLAVSGMLVLALVAAGPAAAKDRNHDKIPDRWEKRHNLSLKVNQAKRDQDRDDLNNRGEYRSGSDPRDDDSDDDGTEDGDENAGTIASFDGTTLTIDLLNGGSITGTVTDETEVKCGDECDQDGEEAPEGVVTRHPEDDDDNSGPGSENEGPGHHGEDDDESNCSVDDLVVGAAVHEAELELKNGDAVFEEIELAKVEATPVAVGPLRRRPAGPVAASPPQMLTRGFAGAPTRATRRPLGFPARSGPRARGWIFAGEGR